MNQRYQGTRIEQPPTLTGVAGEAWRVTLPDLGQREAPDHDATVGGFLMRVPGAHMLWDHYLICVIHLRPIPGVRPPHLRFAGATHELMILALDPGQPLPDTLHCGPGWRVATLRPIDVVEQFAVADDAVADKVLELAVRAVLDGYASPDQDWRAWWTTAIRETAAHFNDGTHQVTKS